SHTPPQPPSEYNPALAARIRPTLHSLGETEGGTDGRRRGRMRGRRVGGRDASRHLAPTTHPLPHRSLAVPLHVADPVRSLGSVCVSALKAQPHSEPFPVPTQHSPPPTGTARHRPGTAPAQPPGPKRAPTDRGPTPCTPHPPRACGPRWRQRSQPPS